MHQYIKKQKTTLSILICLIIVCGFFVYQTIHTIGNMEQGITDAKKTIAQFTTTDTGQSAHTAAISDLQNAVNSLSKNILHKDDVPGFLSHIEDLATKNGVDFSVVNVDTGSQDTTKKLSIAFSVKGTQAAIQTFFDVVQAQPQAVRLSQLFFSITATNVDMSGTKKGHIAIPQAGATGTLEVLSIQ